MTLEFLHKDSYHVKSCNNVISKESACLWAHEYSMNNLDFSKKLYGLEFQPRVKTLLEDYVANLQDSKHLS